MEAASREIDPTQFGLPPENETPEQAMERRKRLAEALTLASELSRSNLNPKSPAKINEAAKREIEELDRSAVELYKRYEKLRILENRIKQLEDLIKDGKVVASQHIKVDRVPTAERKAIGLGSIIRLFRKRDSAESFRESGVSDEEATRNAFEKIEEEKIRLKDEIVKLANEAKIEYTGSFEGLKANIRQAIEAVDIWKTRLEIKKEEYISDAARRIEEKKRQKPNASHEEAAAGILEPDEVGAALEEIKLKDA